MPSRSKFSRTRLEKKASMVQILAFCSNKSWRSKKGSPGFSAKSSRSRKSTRLRISAAAALVKVATSSLSAGTGASALVIRVMIRSTKTAVLPLPAAADTRMPPPVKLMAFCCSAVHSRAIVHSSILKVPPDAGDIV